MPKLFTPADLHAKNLKFEGIERNEEVMKRCGTQIIYLKDEAGELV